MRRIAIAAIFAVLVGAPLAAARNAIDVMPDSLAGIRLGMTRAKANALLPTPVRSDRLEDGYQRLVSGRRKVEVYFRTGTAGVVAVTTWNRTLKTEKHVGPCSSVAALKRAYGKRLQPFRAGGKIVAYRLGNLVFTADDGRRIGVVALGRGSGATYVALNAPACR
jgi:hypothetical protein